MSDRHLGKVLCGTKLVAGVLTAVAVISAQQILVVSAAPRVISQPGTQHQKQAAPAQRTQPQAVQAQPVQQVEVVKWIPGAPQAVQPVIVKNVITQEIVYETSPGLALASAGGSQVLTPANVATTFNRNIRSEDRATLEAAGGAAIAGAATGTVIGAVGGAVAGGTAGAAAGGAAGGALCGTAVATVVAAPITATVAGSVLVSCTVLGPVMVGAGLGGAAGAGAGAVMGAPAGALIGAQAGATTVPGGRAALDRTIADTTWDLESQARVAQGAEPLAGQKPGDSMQSGPEAAANTGIPTTPIIPAGDFTTADLTTIVPQVEIPAVEPPVISTPLIDAPLPSGIPVFTQNSPFAAV